MKHPMAPRTPLLRFATHLAVAGTLSLAACAAHAQVAPTDDSLFQNLGAQPGIDRLVDDFHERLIADARMNRFFKDADHARLKQQLKLQFCEVSGGPCQLQGKDSNMKARHDGQDITKNDFNALVEVLQQTMDAQDIDFRIQNRLLARLAPMHRDIVNAKAGAQGSAVANTKK